MNKGFTLIELLVVVLIICILAAVALPQYQKAVMKARVVQELAVFQSFSQAIDLWILENGFPSSTIDLTGTDATGALHIDIGTPSSSHYNDLGNGVQVLALISSSSGKIRVGNILSDGSRGGCYSLFARRGSPALWYLGTLYNKDGNIATANDCPEYQKIMCQYWATQQNGKGSSTAISQCANFGVTLSPYNE